MVGLPWEQHVAFLGDRSRAAAIDRPRSRTGVRAVPVIPRCSASRSATRSRRRSSAGTEAAASSASSSGSAPRCARRTRTRFVTYVNYPEHRVPPRCRSSTSSLQRLPGATSGVESRTSAGSRTSPASSRSLLAELGARQPPQRDRAARRTPCGSQVDAAFSAGCAGTFVFAWTDEWHRGEDEVLDWDFGLTDRARRPKPALEAVARPLRGRSATPRTDSAVRLGRRLHPQRRPRRCASAWRIARLRYPDVRDDRRRRRLDRRNGGDRRSEFDVRLISTRNRGLSAARNTGLAAAAARSSPTSTTTPARIRTGSASSSTTFARRSTPPSAGRTFRRPTTGRSPPASRTLPAGRSTCSSPTPRPSTSPAATWPSGGTALLAIGGFDPQFRRGRRRRRRLLAAAGAWRDARLPRRGARLAPPAQLGPRLLAPAAGLRPGGGAARAQVAGAVQPARPPDLGRPPLRPRHRGQRSAPRASTTAPGAPARSSRRTGSSTAARRRSCTCPEWYLVLAALAGCRCSASSGTSLLWAVPLLALAVAARSLSTLSRGGFGHDLGRHGATRPAPTRRCDRSTALLHLLQPAARLAGRLAHGLAPWRRRRTRRAALPAAPLARVVVRGVVAPRERVARIEDGGARAPARASCAAGRTTAGTSRSRAARRRRALRIAVEEHGRGRQLVRSPHLAAASPRGAGGRARPGASRGRCAVLTAHWTASHRLAGLR